MPALSLLGLCWRSSSGSHVIGDCAGGQGQRPLGGIITIPGSHPASPQRSVGGASLGQGSRQADLSGYASELLHSTANRSAEIGGRVRALRGITHKGVFSGCGPGGFESEERAAEAYDVAVLKSKGRNGRLNFAVEQYADLLECIDNVSLEELIMIVRRQSQAFSRGTSMYRGVTRHPRCAKGLLNDWPHHDIRLSASVVLWESCS